MGANEYPVDVLPPMSNGEFLYAAKQFADAAQSYNDILKSCEECQQAAGTALCARHAHLDTWRMEAEERLLKIRQRTNATG